MEQQGSLKAKLIGALVTFLGLLIIWFLFKRTILLVFNGLIMVAIVYAGIRFWLWRRQRRRDKGLL